MVGAADGRESDLLPGGLIRCLSPPCRQVERGAFGPTPASASWAQPIGSGDQAGNIWFQRKLRMAGSDHNATISGISADGRFGRNPTIFQRVAIRPRAGHSGFGQRSTIIAIDHSLSVFWRRAVGDILQLPIRSRYRGSNRFGGICRPTERRPSFAAKYSSIWASHRPGLCGATLRSRR